MKLGYSKDQMMKTVYDMDRFMLKKGEMARIALLDEEIYLEITHYLGEGPEGVKGYYICLGDPEAMVQG
ncbi:MAG TPA: hypothetical protein ENI23_10890, partial [bacterium]|nr:hypothetical protein [bacterium]